MSRARDDLSPRFRPLACELLARCAEQRIVPYSVYDLHGPDKLEWHFEYAAPAAPPRRA